MFLIFLTLLFTANSTTIWIANQAGGIFQSTNDGLSFSSQTSGVSTALRSIWAKSATEVWAVGDSGVALFTTNGGTSWTTKSLGTTSNLNCVFWISATTGFIGGDTYFGFTTNSGSTFTTVTGAGANSIYFTDASNGWIALGPGIGKTSNGGSSFVAQTVPTNTGLNSIAFVSSTTGVAVGLAGFICRTTNGGTTWTTVTSPVNTNINYVNFVSATVGYAGYASGLLTTTDAGATWTIVANAAGSGVNSFAFSGTTTGWIVGGTLRESVNSGVSWNTLPNPSPSSPMTSITINGIPLTITTTTTTSGTGTPAPTTYQVTQYYSGDLTCANAFTAMQIVQSSSCTPSSTCTNINNNYGQKVSCVTSLPAYPSGWAALEIWLGSTSCQGTSNGILVAPADTCTGKWVLSTVQFNCSNNLILDCQATTSTCGGCSAKSVTQGGNCITGNPTTSLTIQSYKFTCTSNSATVCFHKDTTIKYKMRKFYVDSIPEIFKDECVNPHIVKSDGVVIYSECGQMPLRLTKDHLVFTERGLIPAVDITTEDVLIGDKKNCKADKIQKEYNQMYYGLNCKESIVYAEGVKCSTFGKMHVIPSLWMKWVSNLVGIETASKIGDYIANLVF